MSSSRCEIDIDPDTPMGIRGDFEVSSGGPVSCQVSSSGSEYEFEIENHRTHAVGIRLSCDSRNDLVEFDTQNGWDTEWSRSLILESRTPNGPLTTSFSVDMRSSTQSRQSERIDTECNLVNIVMTTNPHIDDHVEVDAV
jgi:hypothetical protein